jgi:hypothetical protein
MARNKVIGVSVSAGKFEGYDYRNLMVHTTKEDSKCVGLRAETFKIKFKFLNDGLNLNMKESDVMKLEASDFQNLIGKEVMPTFDQFRNCIGLVVFGSDKNS